jgi:hypothetical protein
MRGCRRAIPFDKLANLLFVEGRSTKQNAQILPDELLFQRASGL